MNMLVLDLRGNRGGLLIQAVRVANTFLQRGQLIVKQKGRIRGSTEPFNALNDSPDPVPLVVLVNGDTASAAEIVAGALQDHDRALIVGESTFRQRPGPTADSTRIRFRVAPDHRQVLHALGPPDSTRLFKWRLTTTTTPAADFRTTRTRRRRSAGWTGKPYRYGPRGLWWRRHFARRNCQAGQDYDCRRTACRSDLRFCAGTDDRPRRGF